MLMIISFFLLNISATNTDAFSFVIPVVHQPKTSLFASTSSSSTCRRSFISTQLFSTKKTTDAAKKELIEKAKEIDPQLENSKKGSYAEAGWSNRLGTVLTPAAIPGVYIACRPFYWNKIDVGGRMTVIELPSDSDKPDLWVHSPVNLDIELKDALAKIGTVKHVVSPNYEHVKYAQQWNEEYPEANMWACPGMMEREPQVQWTGEIPFGCRPPSFLGKSDDGDYNELNPVKGMWDWNLIQPMHLDQELNPFTGKPFFNEIVFYHTPSKSLLFTDAYWNYPKKDGIPNSNYESLNAIEEDEGDWDLAPSVDKVPLGSRLWKFGMDRIYGPFYMNLMIPDEKRKDFVSVTSFISGLGNPSWDIETIIPAHGDVLRGSKFVRAVLKDHFRL